MHCPPRWGNAYIDGTLVDVEQGAVRMPCGRRADVVRTVERMPRGRRRHVNRWAGRPSEASFSTGRVTVPAVSTGTAARARQWCPGGPQ